MHAIAAHDHNVDARQDFDQVVQRYADELHGAATRLCGSRAEADDLVQEAILRAWMFWDRFEEGTNRRAWLHRILMNSFINGYRRKRRERDIMNEVQVEIEVAPQWDDEDARRHDATVGDEVEAALAALPDSFRVVITKVDLEEQSYREVADALGCPIGTVMSRLHRARRQLKHQLRGYAVSTGYATRPVAA